MKKILIVMIAIAGGLFSSNSFAQEEVVKLKKEVRMEEENGIKTLTITTTDGEVVTEEKYSGEAADAKLAELSGTSAQREETTKEVEIIEENGVKIVTITTTVNGQVSQEVYTGEDAERKIEEMELEVTEDTEDGGKLIIKTKTKTEKSTLDE